MLSDLEMLERSNRLLVDAVASVDTGALSAPTPCGDWDVTALLDHITGGNRFSVNILAGMSADEALRSAYESFEDDHDPVAAVVESSAAQLAAFTKPKALAATHDHVAGELGGQAILGLRVHDVCVHIWDLLEAVQPGRPLDAEYVAWAIDELAKGDSLAALHMASELAAPRTPQEVLLAFGRQTKQPRN